MGHYISFIEVIPEVELKNVTRMVLQTIASSVVVGLKERVRMALVNKKDEEVRIKVKKERLDRRNRLEKEWRQRRDELEFETMVYNMGQVLLYDKEEHRQLEMIR